MAVEENLKSSPKYLVVDDEIIKQGDKEEFEDDTGLPLEFGIFVETYEEALKAIKDPRIILCILDIRIPFNKHDKYEKDNGEFIRWDDFVKEKVIDIKKEYGVKLLSLLKIPTTINSAYVDLQKLRKEADKYDHVFGFYKKPNSSEASSIIKPYLKYFKRQESTASSSPKNFDYSSFDEETSSFIKSRTLEIKKLVKRSVEDIINIGNYIIEVQNRLKYGQFYKWLDVEFNWSSRTAARFMSVAQRFSSDTMSELDILPTALYELAPPSVPQEAVDEAFEIAKQGETVTPKIAIALKRKYKNLKKQKEEIPEASTVELGDPSQSGETGRKSSKSILTQLSSSSLKKTNRPKAEILAIKYSENAVKNSWWLLGEKHRLFCGEPTDKRFLTCLPKGIALKINFLPKEDYSLVPSIESISSLTFYSKYSDLEIDSCLEESIKTMTKPHEVIVINYIYYIELLDIVEELDCYAWIAEPDLEKCDRLLEVWRKKGGVVRDK